MKKENLVVADEFGVDYLNTIKMSLRLTNRTKLTELTDEDLIKDMYVNKINHYANEVISEEIIRTSSLIDLLNNPEKTLTDLVQKKYDDEVIYCDPTLIQELRELNLVEHVEWENETWKTRFISGALGKSIDIESRPGFNGLGGCVVFIKRVDINVNYKKFEIIEDSGTYKVEIIFDIFTNYDGVADSDTKE